MRTSTILFLFLLALALAIYGWRAVGWIAVAILLIPILLILLGILAVLLLRAKIKRDVRRFLGSFGRAGPRDDQRMGSGTNGPAPGAQARRPGVIDVEARDATSTPVADTPAKDDRR